MPGARLPTRPTARCCCVGQGPHCADNRLLGAETQKPRKEHLPLGGPGAHHTLFVGCSPLFHGTLALAPMLEVALTLVSAGRALLGDGLAVSASARSLLEADSCPAGVENPRPGVA